MCRKVRHRNLSKTKLRILCRRILWYHTTIIKKVHWCFVYALSVIPSRLFALPTVLWRHTSMTHPRHVTSSTRLVSIRSLAWCRCCTVRPHPRHEFDQSVSFRIAYRPRNRRVEWLLIPSRFCYTLLRRVTLTWSCRSSAVSVILLLF